MTIEEICNGATIIKLLNEHKYILCSGVMSFFMAALRTLYHKETIGKATLEGSLCMLFTIGTAPLLEHFEIPENIISVAGIWIGFFGVKKIGTIANKYIAKWSPRK